LTGAHQPLSCTDCHADKVYVGKATSCVSCHQPDFLKTKAPPHQAAGFPQDCSSCHSTTKWLGTPYDHSRTQFPLTGAHLAATCESCHRDGQYVGKPATCVSCHQTDFANTKQPPHQTAGIATTCTDCHSTTAWVPGVFDHGKTRFPLSGTHVATPCLQCHGDGVYQGKPTTCLSCHQPDFTTAKAPPHAGFPTTCSDCHNTTKWIPGSFNHSATAFPLTGAHLAVNCLGCHGDGVYKGKVATCAGCHQNDFTTARQPPHTGFQTTCTDCHNTTKWIPGTFNHNATPFPLTGAHLAVTCASCHGDGVYRGKPTTCVSCHQVDFTGAKQPPHTGFQTTCADCHSTTKWIPGTFNHSATPFPLTGAHVTTPCLQCHGDGVYKGKATACASCHLTDFTTATNPNHPAAKIPTTCETCHNTTRWTGATFNHDAPYFRIYSGAHQGRWGTCADCHTNPAAYAEFTCLTCHTKSRMDSQHSGRSGYQYTSAKCYSCHQRA
jgi:DnaJ-class molecular chaperone